MERNNKGKGKGKAPARGSTPNDTSNDDVVDITDQVDAFAARHGVSRNEAIRRMQRNAGSSARHAALARTAAQRVLNSVNMAGEVTKHLPYADVARFSAVSRATKAAADRTLNLRAKRDATLPLFQNGVVRRKMSKHTRAEPYEGRPWARGQWRHPLGEQKMFCSAIPTRYRAKYPDKAALLRRLRWLASPAGYQKRRRLAPYGSLWKDVLKVVNGMHFLCRGRYGELQRELEDFARWAGVRSETPMVDAADARAFVRRASQLSYQALYIVMVVAQALSQ